MNKARLLSDAREARHSIIEMVAAAGCGHPGSSLSCTDLLTWLYDCEIFLDDPQRDRFILSKGHAAPALYAQLALHQRISREEMLTLRQLGSRLQGHPNMNDLPDVDMSTGSLGQGLSAAVGMAWADRYTHSPRHTWCLCGDGEFEEGQIWEALMAGSHYHLDNLTVILDENHLQIEGRLDDVAGVCGYADRIRAFGWHTICIDGHDFDQIAAAAKEARECGEPCVIVADTIKGKGVSFMEGKAEWHGRAPDEDLARQALQELEG